MRKIFLTFIFYFCFCCISNAAERNLSDLPFPNSYVSQGIYQSTNTATVTIGTMTVFVSTYPCIIHTINVNTAGTSSKLEIWNTKISTFAGDVKKIGNIDTTSKVSFLYDIYCDSGIAIYNQGSGAADITLTYRLK